MLLCYVLEASQSARVLFGVVERFCLDLLTVVNMHSVATRKAYCLAQSHVALNFALAGHDLVKAEERWLRLELFLLFKAIVNQANLVPRSTCFAFLNSHAELHPLVVHLALGQRRVTNSPVIFVCP